MACADAEAVFAGVTVAMLRPAMVGSAALPFTDQYCCIVGHAGVLKVDGALVLVVTEAHWLWR